MSHPTDGQSTIKHYFAATLAAAIAVLPMAYLGTAAWPLSIWLCFFGLAIYYQNHFAIGSLLLIGGLMLFMLTAIDMNGRSRRRPQCHNNMKKLALAVLNYESAHGRFPPPYIPDDNGMPMHSWRVLVLPFVEETALYERYDFTKPWNHPDNLKLADEMPTVFSCPTCQSPHANYTTSYVAIVGDKTLWPTNGTTRAKDVSDGLYSTLMLIESEAARTHWMAPHDLRFSEIVPTTATGRTMVVDTGHQDVATAAFANGGIHTLHGDHSAEMLKALSTKAGREFIDWDEFYDPPER
ncbi:MAG: hypothetical protein Aurels2KO_22680 [Aureliella sp.]